MDSATLDVLNLLVTTVGAAIIIYQIWNESRWNRRNSSHEALNNMVSGDFVEIIDELLIEFGWDIVAPDQPIETAVRQLSETNRESEIVKLKARTVHLLRLLETVTISCKRNLVDESVCKDYLFSILTNIYRNTESFIADERVRRKQPTVFIHVEIFAEAWAAGRDGIRAQSPNPA